MSWLQQHHLVPGRVATTDYVGNYLEFRYGTRANAFIDDRADVFPAAVERDYGVLLSGSEGWQVVLARYRFDVVLWPRADALASLIAPDPGWKVRISDRKWVVAVRKDQAKGPGRSLVHPPRPRRDNSPGPSRGPGKIDGFPSGS